MKTVTLLLPMKGRDEALSKSMRALHASSSELYQVTSDQNRVRQALAVLDRSAWVLSVDYGEHTVELTTGQRMGVAVVEALAN